MIFTKRSKIPLKMRQIASKYAYFDAQLHAKIYFTRNFYSDRSEVLFTSFYIDLTAMRIVESPTNTCAIINKRENARSFFLNFFFASSSYFCIYSKILTNT